MERTEETLKARVRETPLLDRLNECQKRIGNMCAERRAPRMCIPVQHSDDDFFICTTLADAQATVAALQARVQELEKNRDKPIEQVDHRYWDVNELRANVELKARHIDEIQSQLTQRTAELDAVQRERNQGKEATVSEKITIDQTEYNALKLAEKKLSALEAAGVDNWEWYGDAMATVFGDDEEEE